MYIYLDDSTLASDASVVVADLKVVLASSAAIGLELNPAKCELLVMDEPDSDAVAEIARLLPGIKFLEPCDAELLGAPLTDEALPAALESKVAQIGRLAERLPLLKSHAALFTLKNCLSMPKMTYLLRCTPSWKAPTELASFDAIMRNSLESICNGTMDDQAWAQASLPVARGGLAIRSAQQLSVPAFLASIASTVDLVTAILGSPHEDPDEQEALALWSSMTNESPIPTSHLQSDWDRPILENLSATLLSNAKTSSDKARILASCRKEAGAWLNAFPSPNQTSVLFWMTALSQSQ